MARQNCSPVSVVVVCAWVVLQSCVAQWVAHISYFESVVVCAWVVLQSCVAQWVAHIKQLF